MNHIIIIGNGFDLAHGLETSYMDFFKWYLRKISLSIETNNHYNDDIVEISFKQNKEFNGRIIPISSPNFKSEVSAKDPLKLFEILNQQLYSVKFKSYFINELFHDLIEKRWVDIENLYYSWIKRIYKHKLTTANSKDDPYKSIKTLNISFNEIITHLKEYLRGLNNDVKFIPEIKNHFDSIEKSLIHQNYDGLCILNFNYTDTIKKYLTNDNEILTINIHGSLLDQNNPIIFGYGDETDDDYKNIENLNDNEYLRFMKSFGYFKSSSYQQFINFLNGGDYQVNIMGHSCGISDRVLLKRIFEDKNCKKIKIYYHEKSQTDNDYTNKCMDISRHFSLEEKNKMREFIIPFPNSVPLISFK